MTNSLLSGFLFIVQRFVSLPLEGKVPNESEADEVYRKAKVSVT